MRELAADMTAERLEDYIARLTGRNDGAGPSGGIIVAQSANGYIRGMLSYRIMYDLYRGPRIERSRSRETGGVGLSLSVARTIVRAHGGDIEVVNRPEGGARVRVSLPGQ